MAKLDPFGDTAAAVLANNPHLRQRLTKLIEAMIRDAEYTIKHGTPQQRFTLMSKVIPQLMRSMTSADASDEERQEVSAFKRMMAEVRGEDVPE